MDKEQFNQQHNREKSNASQLTKEDAEKGGSNVNLPPQLNIQASQNEAKEEPKEEKAEEQKETKKGSEEKERFSMSKETAGDDGPGDNNDSNGSDGGDGNANSSRYQPNNNNNKNNKNNEPKADNAERFQVKETAKQQKENIEKPLNDVGGGGSGSGADGSGEGGAEAPGGGSGAGNAPNGLPNEVNNKMQTAFGADFSNVNIHKDSDKSKEIGAFAYTQGNDVHFAPGKFQPFTPQGQELIGHELAHVVQQSEGKVEANKKAGNLPVNDNPALEKEADVKGKKAAQAKPDGKKGKETKGDKAPKGKTKPEKKKKPTPKKAVAQTKLPPGRGALPPMSSVPVSKIPAKGVVPTSGDPIAPDPESLLPEFVLIGDILNIEYDILEQNGSISLDLDLQEIATIVKAEVTITEGAFESGKLFVESDHVPGVQFELLVNADGTVDPILTIDSQTLFHGMEMLVTATITNEGIDGIATLVLPPTKRITDTLTVVEGSATLDLNVGGNFSGNIIVETNDGFARGEASVTYDFENESWAGSATVETQRDESIELPPSATLVIPSGASLSLTFGPDGTTVSGGMTGELTVGLQTTDGIELSNLNNLSIELGLDNTGLTITSANFNSETTAFGMKATVNASYLEDDGFSGTISLELLEPKNIAPQLSASAGQLVYNFTPENDTFSGELTVTTHDGFVKGEAQVNYDQVTDVWTGGVTMTLEETLDLGFGLEAASGTVQYDFTPDTQTLDGNFLVRSKNGFAEGTGQVNLDLNTGIWSGTVDIASVEERKIAIGQDTGIELTLPADMQLTVSFGPDGTQILGAADLELTIDLNVDSINLTGLAAFGVELGFNETGITVLSLEINSDATVGGLDAQVTATINQDGITGTILVDVVDEIALGEGLEIVSGNLLYDFGPEPDSFDGEITIQTTDGWAQGKADVTLDPITSEWSGSAVLTSLEDKSFPLGTSGTTIVLPTGIELEISFGPDGTVFEGEIEANVFVDLQTDEGFDLTDLTIFTIVLGFDNTGITVMSCQIESDFELYGFTGFVSMLFDDMGIIGSARITLAEAKPLGDSLTATSGEILYNFGPDPDEFRGVMVVETNDGFLRGEADVYLDPATSEWAGSVTLTSETDKVIPVGGETNIILPPDMEITASFGPDGTVIDGFVSATLEVGINSSPGGIDITGISITEIELGIDNEGLTLELLRIYTSVDLLGMNAEINAIVLDGEISGTISILVTEHIPLGDKLTAVSGSLEYVFGPEPDALSGDLTVQTNDQIAQGIAKVELDPVTSEWSGSAELSLLNDKVIPLGSGAQIVLPKDMFIEVTFGPDGTTVDGDLQADLIIDLNVEEGLDLEGLLVASVEFSLDETGLTFVSLDLDTIVDVFGMEGLIDATLTPDGITGIITITLTEEKTLPGNLIATGGMIQYDFTVGGTLSGEIEVKSKEDFATGTALAYFDLVTKEWSGVAELLTTHDKVIEITEGVEITIPAGMEITIGFSPEGSTIDGSATILLDVDLVFDNMDLSGTAEVKVSLSDEGLKVDSFHLLTTTTILDFEAEVDFLVENGEVSGMFTIELTEEKLIGGYILVTAGILQFGIGTGNDNQHNGEVSVITTDGFAEGVARVSVDKDTKEWSGDATLFSKNDKHFTISEGVTLTLPAGISVEVEFGPEGVEIEATASVEVTVSTDEGLQAAGVAGIDLSYSEENGLALSPNTIMLAVTGGLTTPDMTAIMKEGTLSTDVDAGAMLTIHFDGESISSVDLEATGSFSDEERRLGRISFSGTMNMRPLSLNGMLHAVSQADLQLISGQKFSTVLAPGSQFFVSIDEQGISNIDASLSVEWRTADDEALARLTLIGMLPRDEGLSMEGALELLKEIVIKEPTENSLGFSILKGSKVGVTLEEAKVTALSGAINMHVSDIDGPLLEGEFEGDVAISDPDQNLSIQSGSGSVTLMRDYVMEFDSGDVTILEPSGVEATFAEGELQTIGGLVAASYSDGESIYEISAEMEYDVVNKSILSLDADISTDKVFTLFDGQMEISELSGGLSIRNDQLVQIGGHAKLEAELGDIHLAGEADLAWIRDEDGESAFIGSGYLEFSWFKGEDDPHQFIMGRVDASIDRDEFDLYGQVEVGIMEGLTGAASIQMDEEMDPVLSASLTYQATVMEADELWADEFGFEIYVPVLGIVSIEAGILFGASIETLPLILFGTAGISDWRPKSGEMPDFEAELAATWGINVSAKIMAYVGVLVGIPAILNASAGIRAGLGIDIPIMLNPYVSLYGNKDGVGGELGINLSIAPVLQLLIEAYVRYEVLGIWDGEKIWELYQQQLGDLGEINWEGSFTFGDEAAIPSGGGGQAPPQMEAPVGSTIPAAEDTGKDSDLGYGKNEGPSEDEEGGLGGLMDGFEGPSEEKGEETETDGMGSELARIGRYADGLSAVAEMIGIIKDGISAFIKGSIVGFLLWWIFKKPNKQRIDELKNQIKGFKVELVDEGFIKPGSMINDILNVLDGSYSIFAAIFDNNAPYKELVKRDYHMQATIDERAEICRELLDGPTANGAEQALYEVARYTKQADGKTAVRELINKSYGLNKWNKDFHGKEQRWLNDLLDDVYGNDYNYNSSATFTAEPGAYIVKEGRGWNELATTAYGDASYAIYLQAYPQNSNANSPYAHLPEVHELKTIALSTIGSRFTIPAEIAYTHQHETYDWIAANVYGNADYAGKLQALNPFVEQVTLDLPFIGSVTVMPKGKSITLPSIEELGNPWIEVSPVPIGNSTYTLWVESATTNSIPVMYAGFPQERVIDIANIAKQTEEGKSAGDALFNLASFTTETTQLDADNAVSSAGGLLDYLIVSDLFAFETAGNDNGTNDDGSVPIGSAQPGDIVNPNGMPLSAVADEVYAHGERAAWITAFGPNEGYSDGGDSGDGNPVEQQHEVAQAEGLANTARTNDSSKGIGENVSTRSTAKQTYFGGVAGDAQQTSKAPDTGGSNPTSVPAGMVLLPTPAEMDQMDALPASERGVAPKSTIEAKNSDSWAGLASLAYNDWSKGLDLADYADNKGVTLQDGNEIKLPTASELTAGTNGPPKGDEATTSHAPVSADGPEETTDEETTETRVLEPGNKVKVIEGDTWSNFAKEAYGDFTVFVKLVNHPDNADVKTLPKGGIVTLPTIENLEGIPEFGLGLSLNGFPLLTEMVKVPTEDGLHHVWVEDRGDKGTEENQADTEGPVEGVWMMASDPFELEPEVTEMVQDTVNDPIFHPHALSIQSMILGEQTTEAIDNTRVDIQVMVDAHHLASENEAEGGTTATNEPFEEKYDRAELERNSNSWADSRWKVKGNLSKYGKQFHDIIEKHIKAIFKEDLTLDEVVAKIEALEKYENKTKEVEELSAKLFAANQHAVVEVLDVENNPLYQKRMVNGKMNTYCNVYAHDVVAALGGYLPRVWWKEDAEEKIKAGETVEAVYGETVEEMRANDLVKWMAEFGGDFGWRKETDMSNAQKEANSGKIAIILAARKGKGSGHVSVILSETDQHKADGDAPLTSQAGSSNHANKADKTKWWENASHKDGAAWIFEGKIDSPILTPDQVGGNMGNQTTVTATTTTGTGSSNDDNNNNDDNIEIKPPYSITKSVGKNGVNKKNDVKVVQTLLQLHSCYQGEIHGNCDDYTIQVIEDFQLDTFGWADGKISVGQDTWNALVNVSNQNENETETETGTGTPATADGNVSEEITDEVVDHIKLREGYRHDVYKDTLGHLTAGYGHLLSKAERLQYPEGSIVPFAVIEQWFEQDSGDAYANALQKAISIDFEAQTLVNALTAVNFQLGIYWNTKHKKTWANLESHSWVNAAHEAADSKWFEQTPVRVFDFQRALLTLAGLPTDYDSMIAFNEDMIAQRNVDVPGQDNVMAFNPLEVTTTTEGDNENEGENETANNSTDTETGEDTYSSTIEELKGSVGQGGNNDTYDVMLVQELLHKAGYDSGPIDGLIGSITIGAIKNFQKVNFDGSSNGLIEPNGPTWSQLIIIASGEDTQEGVPPGGTRVDKNGIVFGETANMRSEPDTTTDNVMHELGYNDHVYVLKEFSEGWYFVDSDCGMGYVAKHLIKTNLPDPESSLYKIASYPTCYSDIYSHYKDLGYTPTTGFDDRHIMMAVYLANQGNAGISIDMEKFEESQSSVVNWFDNQDDNRAVYQSIVLQKGFNIWLPSMTYVNLMVKSGDIATRPDWVDSGIEVGKGITGFTDGLLTGFFGGIWNTITGLFDIGKELIALIGKVATGAIMEDLESMFEFIKGLDASKGQEILDSIIQGAKDGFDNFEHNWNNPNHYNKWEFRGKIVGNIVLEVVLAIFTGGLGNAAKWLAKLEKISKPLFNILKRIGRKIEDVIPDKIKHKEGDTDLGDTAFEKQQAIMMAKTITEAHDTKNSSIPVLKASLKVVEQKYKKHITRFDIDPKAGKPGHYTVKMVGSEHNIDNDYTPGNSVVPRDWDKFETKDNDEFIAKLKEFRGDDVLDRDKNFAGGEGQLFFSPSSSTKALKRWFAKRTKDMPKSVKLLEDAKSTVKGNAILDKDMEVVSVFEKGTDWIKRDFDPTSIKLKSALSDPKVAEARGRLMQELAGKTDEISVNLHKKLSKNPPSANLHWSPSKGKILVIDMM